MSSIEDNPVWKLIDGSAYLLLNKLFEPRENSLTIVLEEAVVHESHRGTRVIASAAFSGVAPIEPSETTFVFEVHWKNYVSYCVTEEMHGSCGEYDDEEHTGRRFRVYSRSHFLDFVQKDTGAHSEPYRHYKIVCENHMIDVASSTAPELTASSRGGARLADA